MSNEVKNEIKPYHFRYRVGHEFTISHKGHRLQARIVGYDLAFGIMETYLLVGTLEGEQIRKVFNVVQLLRLEEERDVERS